MTKPLMLFRDTLLRTTRDGQSLFRRVLFIPATCERVALITVAVVPAGGDAGATPLDTHALPEWVPADELAAALESGDITIVKDDPFFAELRPESEFSEVSRTSRDLRWRAIESIVSVLDETGTPAFLDTALRWELVQQARERTGSALDKIYAWLRTYCQRGQLR